MPDKLGILIFHEIDYTIYYLFLTFFIPQRNSYMPYSIIKKENMYFLKWYGKECSGGSLLPCYEEFQKTYGRPTR